MGLQAAQVPSPTVNSNHRRKRRNWQRLSCPWEPRKVRKAAAALAVATVLACFCFPALFLPLPLGSLPLSITSPKELMPSEVEDAAEVQRPLVLRWFLLVRLRGAPPVITAWRIRPAELLVRHQGLLELPVLQQ